MKNKYRIVLLICFIIIGTFSRSYGDTAFKYYDLKSLKFFNKVLYWDKKVYNNLIIQFKDRQGCINITALPLTYAEFKKYTDSSNNGHSELLYRKTTLSVNGEKIDASVRPIGDRNCSIDVNEYHDGIAFMINYFGICDTSKYLTQVLSNIHFRNNLEKEHRKARKDFDSILDQIKMMDIPIFGPSYDHTLDFTQMGLSKRISFSSEVEHLSLKIFLFYKQYFENRAWKPYKDEDKGDWNHNKFYYVWTDEHDELILSIFIIDNPDAKNDSKSIQSIYLNLSPFKDDQEGYCEIVN